MRQLKPVWWFLGGLALLAASKGQGQEGEHHVVTVEFFYSVTCPHCHDFLRGPMLPQLIDSLPGGEVVVNIMPLVPSHSTADTCKADPTCALAVAPLCVLKQTGTGPQKADSANLRGLLKFLACDIEDTFAGVRDQAKTKACAVKAGIDWEGPQGLHRCAFGDTPGLELLKLSKVAQVRTEMTFQNKGFMGMPGIPWVIVDDRMFDCSDKQCMAVILPKHEVQLQKPGSLLSLVCMRLNQFGSNAHACGDLGAAKSISAGNSDNIPEVKMKPCKKCEEDAAKISKSVKFSDARLAECPGETRASHKCDQASFRVCLRLLDDQHSPLVFGHEQNWWQWSKQTDIQWDDAMRARGGDHWCSCGLCVTEAVEEFGCEKMDIQCDATDLAFADAAPSIDAAYAPLKACVQKKCPAKLGGASRLYNNFPVVPGDHSAVTYSIMAGICAGLVIMGVVTWHRLRVDPPQVLLDVAMEPALE